MFKKVLLFVFIFGFLFSCTLPEADDIQPPVPLLIYPYEGAVISDNINVIVEAYDDVEMHKVWIYLDGILIGEVTKRPYQIPLNIAPYQDNLAHVMQAAAMDKSENIGYSPLVTFVISDSPDIVDPTVTIVNPQDGQIVEGIVRISAIADDERSIQKVAFFIDGDSVGENSAYPYNYTWNTEPYADSTDHTIYAKAFDGGNNSAYSDGVTVTVYPSRDLLPPVVKILYPVSGATITGTVNVAVDANDNFGVTRVEFYVDGILQSAYTDTQPPYGFAWNTAPLADLQQHTLYVKAYDAAGNVGTSDLMVLTIQ